MHLCQSISASSLSTRKYQYNSDYKQCATFQITLYAFVSACYASARESPYILNQNKRVQYRYQSHPQNFNAGTINESELHLKERICHLPVHLQERICHLQVLYEGAFLSGKLNLQINVCKIMQFFPEYIKMIKVTRNNNCNCMIIPVVYGN